MTHKITDQKLFDNRKLLPKDIKENWLNALRSGKFRKGIQYLCHDDKYCCLGVLLEINGFKSEITFEKTKKYYSKDTSASSTRVLVSDKSIMQYFKKETADFSGFVVTTGVYEYNSLTALNDNTETFDEVIQVIEKFF